MDERTSPGALRLAYRAARAQWTSAPESLSERFAGTPDPDGAAVDAPAFARALHRWTGLSHWTTAFATVGAARLALLCAVDEFHHRYGTGRRVVLVPASRAAELARPIAVARYRCVAVAEAAPGVPRSSALQRALEAYGRDVAAVWLTHLGDGATLERREAQWRPLQDVGVKFVAEGASWAWAFGRVPLATLGIDGAVLPFPETFGGLGPHGVALGTSDGLAAVLPIPPNGEALTDRGTSARFLAAARALVEHFTPLPDPPASPLARKRRATSGKTVDEPFPVTEDTDRLDSERS